MDPPQPRQAADGLLCCLRHLRLFRETLDDTVALYATLGMVAMPGSVQLGGTRSKRAEAPAPYASRYWRYGTTAQPCPMMG